MARVSPASPEQVEDALRHADVPLRVQIYAQRPELALKFLEFGTALRENRLLPGRLIELVRLRVAFWNQCRSCMAVRYAEGLDDGRHGGTRLLLERPSEAPDLSDAERAAIGFGDLMATDHLAITDETFDDLREHFSEPEIVELCMNVALFVGFGRMGSALHMVDDLPDALPGRGRGARHPVGIRRAGLIGSWTGGLDGCHGNERIVTGRTPTPVVPLGDLLVLSAARAPENVVLAFPDARATAAELLAAATVTARGSMPSACAVATGSGS